MEEWQLSRALAARVLSRHVRPRGHRLERVFVAVAVAVCAWTVVVRFFVVFSGSSWPHRSPRTGGVVRLRADGFDPTPKTKTPSVQDRTQQMQEDLMSKLTEGITQAQRDGKLGGFKESQKLMEKPEFMLPGPLKPPAAPATYRALSKLYLRKAPSRYAEVVTGMEIEKDSQFEVLEAKEDEEDETVLYLRTDAKHDYGWVLERGVAGKWAGKRVVKRVPGSLRMKQAVHSISTLDRAEVVDGEEFEESNPEDDVPPPIMATLEDPAVRKMFMKAGLPVDDLKKNPELLLAVMKKLYGDDIAGEGEEVVS